MKYCLTVFLVLLCLSSFAVKKPGDMRFYKADNQYFKYTGRIDFSDKQKPRFWSPGVYITARFKGPSCDLLINDEVLYGSTQNYIEIVIDGNPRRIQTTGKTNMINIADNLPGTEHSLLICKNTESGMGYLEFIGLRCEKLLPVTIPERKIEYIGDSITAGASSDASQTPCNTGQWYDQHNAYMSYGAITSRELNAQWQLTAVAGIGLIHSCCDMKVLLPQVFDKMLLRSDSIQWDFKRYQPNVVTICLGQNDGYQDSVKFCSAYVNLIHTVRSKYPAASIVCLSSPMANAGLRAELQRYINGIVSKVNAAGDTRVSRFFFSRAFNSGCAEHPSVAEHQLIAGELTAYLKELKGW